jgi:hypothetical protein
MKIDGVPVREASPWIVANTSEMFSMVVQKVLFRLSRILPREDHPFVVFDKDAVADMDSRARLLAKSPPEGDALLRSDCDLDSLSAINDIIDPDVDPGGGTLFDERDLEIMGKHDCRDEPSPGLSVDRLRSHCERGFPVKGYEGSHRHINIAPSQSQRGHLMDPSRAAMAELPSCSLTSTSRIKTRPSYSEFRMKASARSKIS